MNKDNLREKCETYFSIITDPRSQCDIKHKLVDILIIVMCSILSGLDELDKIIEYADNKRVMLKKYFGIEEIPSKSTLIRVLNVINVDDVWLAIICIMRSMILLNKKIINIDGKTIRSTEKMKSYERSLQILSAYATECGICLGELPIHEKSNEIPAVRELLDILDIKNSIVTLDAMHCQKETVEKIIDKKGNYIIGLKGNQKNFYADMDRYFKDILSSNFIADKEKYEYCETIEKNRDRIETRKCYKLNNISWYPEAKEWKELSTVFAINRIVEKDDKTTEEMSYYITDLNVEVEKLLEYTRKHWQVEAMHYMLDVTYNEDKCRVLSENTQRILNKFRKMGISMHKKFLEKKKSKKSVKGNMFNCLLNDKLLIELISMEM